MAETPKTDAKTPNPYSLFSQPSREYIVQCSSKAHAVEACAAVRELFDAYVGVTGYKNASSFVISYHGEDGPIPEQTRRAISFEISRIDDGAKARVPEQRKALENIASRPA